jgi:hypothetical protein
MQWDGCHDDRRDTALEEWVCRSNIERYRLLLAKAATPRERAVLSALIADEGAVLEQLISGPTEPASRLA